MNYRYSNQSTAALFTLRVREEIFEHYFKEKDPNGTLYTIVWNRGSEQTVMVDEVNYRFAANAVLPIMMSQSFRFEKPEQVVAWQFNREFYCIVNHDAEVGCVGFVFYGPSPTMFIQFDADNVGVMERLLAVFEEEFILEEDNKADMLRLLLVRLIIRITRLAKKKYLGTEDLVEEKFNLIRQFHLQVEIYYRKEHKVQFYAGLLNKSPKTVANIFSLYSKKTPLQVIRERIISEARRLFYYTDKPVKEIAADLGFEDVAHFSKFFKTCTNQNPSALKKVVKG